MSDNYTKNLERWVIATARSLADSGLTLEEYNEITKSVLEKTKTKENLKSRIAKLVDTRPTGPAAWAYNTADEIIQMFISMNENDLTDLRDDIAAMISPEWFLVSDVVSNRPLQCIQYQKIAKDKADKIVAHIKPFLASTSGSS